jgi:putative membrane protein insertion efficiency factor
MTLVRLLLIGPIQAYRYLISPFLAPSCRYFPSCSAYACEALEHHGAIAGGWLALKRVARCHPWGGMGYDPVPDAVDEKSGRRAGQRRAAH